MVCTSTVVVHVREYYLAYDASVFYAILVHRTNEEDCCSGIRLFCIPVIHCLFQIAVTISVYILYIQIYLDQSFENANWVW